jgi:pimeloyl-ACP methyl ester carboxylesterase
VSFEFPAPRKAVDVVMDDGAIIRLRQHGTPGRLRLALSHGNGLAIDGYYPFWHLLTERYELILFDFRNHGQNPLHGFADHRWPCFVEDLENVFAAIQENFGARRTVGVFHSLAAVTASMAAQRYGARWDPLVLFDPPFYPPPGHPVHAAQLSNEDAIAARAERRTTTYADPSKLAESFARNLPRWRPEAYQLMARATLRRDPKSGQWVLACPREFEAQVFRSNRNPATWEGLKRMPVAVKLIGADPALPEAGPSAHLGRAAAAEAGLEYEAIPDTTHFLQIEKPYECVVAMESFLRQQGLFE